MRNFFEIFANVRMAVSLFIGFASGLPLALSGDTLSYWLAKEGVSLKLIGIFSLVGLPYTWKFLWSPLLDRYVPPFLGRRRGWIAVIQLLLAVTIAVMGFSNPVVSPWWLAFAAVMVSFFSASQDIVIDAYRIELLKPEERGMGVGLSSLGYRIAMIFSGAFALFLADHFSMQVVYAIMAAAMALCCCITFFMPEPDHVGVTPGSLKDAIVLPFRDFFKRRGATEILLFCILYKIGDVLLGRMTTPLLVQLQFTGTEIAAINKGVGTLATIAGTLLGGLLLARLGMIRSLLLFGVMQAATNLVFLALSHAGHDLMWLTAAIGVDNLAGGMGSVAFTAFLMSLCNRGLEATQYALLTSFMAQARVWGAAPSGAMAESLGWHSYFVVCTVIAAPALILLIFRYRKWDVDSDEVKI
jgi:PAT family beta-lactamase induction signal transducer AmpG